MDRVVGNGCGSVERARPSGEGAFILVLLILIIYHTPPTSMKDRAYKWAGEPWDAFGANELEAAELTRIVTEELDLVDTTFSDVVTYTLANYPHLEILRFKETTIRSFIDRTQKKARGDRSDQQVKKIHGRKATRNSSTRAATGHHQTNKTAPPIRANSSVPPVPSPAASPALAPGQAGAEQDSTPTNMPASSGANVRPQNRKSPLMIAMFLVVLVLTRQLIYLTYRRTPILRFHSGSTTSVKTYNLNVYSGEEKDGFMEYKATARAIVYEFSLKSRRRCTIEIHFEKSFDLKRLTNPQPEIDTTNGVLRVVVNEDENVYKEEIAERAIIDSGCRSDVLVLKLHSRKLSVEKLRGSHDSNKIKDIIEIPIPPYVENIPQQDLGYAGFE